MIKIILDKEDLTMISDDQLRQIEIADENQHGKIAIIVDENNYETLEKILKKITVNRKEFLFDTHNGWAKILIGEILYIESYGSEIVVHTHHRGDVFVKQPLYQLEALLQPFHLIRIGKSYLVNLSKVIFIRSKLNAKLELELVGGIKLEVMRSFVKSFKEALGIGGKK